jgi:hypothetical protein
MTTPAGNDYGTWCAACRHMIVKDGRRGYVHASDDDWAKPAITSDGRHLYDCSCAASLRPCKPPEMSRLDTLAYTAAKLRAGRTLGA